MIEYLAKLPNVFAKCTFLEVAPCHLGFLSCHVVDHADCAALFLILSFTCHISHSLPRCSFHINTPPLAHLMFWPATVRLRVRASRRLCVPLRYPPPPGALPSLATLPRPRPLTHQRAACYSRTEDANSSADPPCCTVADRFNKWSLRSALTVVWPGPISRCDHRHAILPSLAVDRMTR